MYLCSNSPSLLLSAATVLSAPEIVTEPATTFVYIYQTVVLSCVATGNPQPTIEWFKDDVLIAGELSPILVLPQASLDARAVYHCLASNSQGNAMSSDAVVNLRGASMELHCNYYRGFLVFVSQMVPLFVCAGIREYVIVLTFPPSFFAGLSPTEQSAQVTLLVSQV